MGWEGFRWTWFLQHIWQTEKYPHTSEITLGQVKHFTQTRREYLMPQAPPIEIKTRRELKELWKISRETTEMFKLKKALFFCNSIFCHKCSGFEMLVDSAGDKTLN